MLKHIETSDEFKSEVKDVSGKVIVTFWADWCGPCKKFAKVLEDFSAQDSTPVIKVNVDVSKDITKDHGVKSIPALFLYEDGVLKQGPLAQMPLAKLVELVK